MSEIKFSNIDLDIESLVDISPIIHEWGDRICVHRQDEIDGIYYGSFETAYSGIDNIIEHYVSLINGLSPAAKEIWYKAIKRDFDFGYESGTKPSNFHSRISSQSINKLAKVGGTVVITIYPNSVA